MNIRLLKTQAPGTTQGIVEGLGVRGVVNMPLVEAIIPVTIVGGSPDESHLGTVALVDDQGRYLSASDANPIQVQTRGGNEGALEAQLVDPDGNAIAADNPLPVAEQNVSYLATNYGYERETFTIAAGNSYVTRTVSLPSGFSQRRLSGVMIVSSRTPAVAEGYRFVVRHRPNTSAGWTTVDAFYIATTGQSGGDNFADVAMEEYDYDGTDTTVRGVRRLVSAWTSDTIWTVGIDPVGAQNSVWGAVLLWDNFGQEIVTPP